MPVIIRHPYGVTDSSILSSNVGFAESLLRGLQIISYVEIYQTQ